MPSLIGSVLLLLIWCVWDTVVYSNFLPWRQVGRGRAETSSRNDSRKHPSMRKDKYECGNRAGSTRSLHVYRNDLAHKHRDVRQHYYVLPTHMVVGCTAGLDHLSVLTEGDTERDAAVQPSVGCRLLLDVHQKHAVREGLLEHQRAQLPNATLADRLAIQSQRSLTALGTYNQARHPLIIICTLRYGRVSALSQAGDTETTPRRVGWHHQRRRRVCNGARQQARATRTTLLRLGADATTTGVLTHPSTEGGTELPTSPPRRTKRLPPLMEPSRIQQYTNKRCCDELIIMTLVIAWQ